MDTEASRAAGGETRPREKARGHRENPRRAGRWRRIGGKVSRGDVGRVSSGEGRGPDGAGNRGSRPRDAEAPGGADPEGGMRTYLRAGGTGRAAAVPAAAAGSGLEGGRPGTQRRLLPAEAPPRPGPPPVNPSFVAPLNPFKPSPR